MPDAQPKDKHHSWAATVAMFKDLFALLRDLFIFALGVLLVVFPAKLNDALVKAGFEEGSIVGLKWKHGVAETTNKLQLAEDTISKISAENEYLRKALIEAQVNVTGGMPEGEFVRLNANAQRLSEEVRQVQASVNTTLQTNQELLSKAPPSAREKPPDEAFCYQEDRLKDGMSRYSVHCHETKENCEKARGPSMVRKQTACTLTDLSSARWTPGHPGYIGSWYQFNRVPFGSPFPQLQ